VVKREVGALLKSVQEELALQEPVAEDVRLLPADARGCRHGGVVARRQETPAQKRYNPAFSKADLFRPGLHRDHSGHSTGAALDPLFGRSESRQFGRASMPARDYGDCTANVNLRAPDGSVDMGTGYDCFRRQVAHGGEIRHRRPSAAGGRSWFMVMARRGFVNYSKEWWHFSLPGAGGQAYDFPISRGSDPRFQDQP
jgi:D-alanyl-D-alanine dipeptidase